METVISSEAVAVPSPGSAYENYADPAVVFARSTLGTVTKFCNIGEGKGMENFIDNKNRSLQSYSDRK